MFLCADIHEHKKQRGEMGYETNNSSPVLLFPFLRCFGAPFVDWAKATFTFSGSR